MLLLDKSKLNSYPDFNGVLFILGFNVLKINLVFNFTDLSTTFNLSKTFFDEKEVALIPKVKDDVLTIKIGDEKERPIYNLGDGIQSIILITLPLFLYLDISKVRNTNVLVFIEEPEIGLHPSLQRTLIETLLDKRFENFQFFFTTHSNHFLDMQLKIGIFPFILLISLLIRKRVQLMNSLLKKLILIIIQH